MNHTLIEPFMQLRGWRWVGTARCLVRWAGMDIEAGAGDAPNMLVLGATGGIGGAVARLAAARGWRLTLAARRADLLEALGAQLGARTVVTDATVPAQVDRLVMEAAEHGGGRLDGIAHCVGSLLLKPAHLTRPDEFDATIAANLTSAFNVVRAGTRVMQQGGGAIVLCSSAAAQIGLANHEAIAAAKAGIIGLVRSAAATYAAKGIRVNCVAPGLVRTPLTARITSSPAAEQASLGMHALNRLGEPDDVAQAIDFLLDPAHDWITGQCLGVDGGLGSIRTR